MARTVAETQAALTRLIGQPMEAAEFSDEVDSAVRQILTFDGWCLFGTDPRRAFGLPSSVGAAPSTPWRWRATRLR